MWSTPGNVCKQTNLYLDLQLSKLKLLNKITVLYTTVATDSSYMID